MYAVIKTGGKQYRVNEGDLVRIERLEGDVGDKIAFEEILLVGDDSQTLAGSPSVDGAEVSGTIVEQSKGDKIVVFKFKRRKMYRRKTGHRQQLTDVRIDAISGLSKPKTEKAAKTADPKPEPQVAVETETSEPTAESTESQE